MTVLSLSAAVTAGIFAGLLPVKYAVALIFLAVTVYLYVREIEYFIVFVLMINEEFFYLLPREPLGGANYQDLLFVVLAVSGALCFFLRRDRDGREFAWHIAALLLLVLMAVANSYRGGQSIVLGLKASKAYFLILFYWIFVSRGIDRGKLIEAVIAAGLVLSLLNNVQYLLYGDLRIFHFEREFELERAGRLRYLIGDFFTIFSPLLAFGEYLKTRKKGFLLAFLYMITTVFVQGQVRMVMLGLTISSIAMLYVEGRLNRKVIAIAGGLLLAAVIGLSPQIKNTPVGELVDLTSSEISEGEGNIGLRLVGYGIYAGEVAKSPIVGRGIWNDLYTDNNPEDLKFMGVHLADLGIMGVLFHFGILGLIWLATTLVRTYKMVFEKFGKLREGTHPGVFGYFVFSIVTLASLNGFTARRTIVYLALALALVVQTCHQERKEGIPKGAPCP